jgi:class 3 adenylate cyclase
MVERCGTDCPTCGSANPDGKNFCGECGAQLPIRGSIVSAGVALTPLAPPTPDVERRQLTVMFCDLVGSTALASRFDPEGDAAYHKCTTETIARHDGFVAKYMGDGVLVYFGYPHAQEDDSGLCGRG